MLGFNYEIKIDENGMPFVELSKDYEENPEDKFMILDLVSRMFTGIMMKPELLDKYSEKEQEYFRITNSILYVIRNDSGSQLKKRMDELGITEMLNKTKNYHISVSTIYQRNSLNYNGIIYEDKIFRRMEGLRVLVLETMEVFELVGGIDNVHWIKN